MQKLNRNQIQNIINFCRQNKLFVHENVLWKYDSIRKISCIMWPSNKLNKNKKNNLSDSNKNIHEY